MRDINADEAQGFRDWLSEVRHYAQASISGHIKRARQVYTSALNAGIITCNPFAQVLAGTQANDAKSKYISTETVNRAIDMAPDSQWRLIIALCRYAGLRCPSEVLALKWSQVDFSENKLNIPGAKGKDGETRWRTMPILPELRAYLEDAFNPEQIRVIHRYSQSNSNLRKGFLQILEKAQITPWPRLFHNLRGSLETDLANHLPLHVVTSWLGNSERVARKHYLKVTPEHFAIAINRGVGQQVGAQVAATTENGCKELDRFPQNTGENTKHPANKENQGRPGRTRTRDKGIMSPLL